MSDVRAGSLCAVADCAAWFECVCRWVYVTACRYDARLRVALVGGGAPGVHARASKVGGAAARVGTRAGACERVLFVTIRHCSKYAFIKVFRLWCECKISWFIPP